EVGAREVVEDQAVIELKQRGELFLEVSLDRLLSFQKLVQGSIQAILRDRAIGHAQKIIEASRRVPVLGQCKFRAGSTQAVDDLDGHDIGGANGLLALGNMVI